MIFEPELLPDDLKQDMPNFAWDFDNSVIFVTGDARSDDPAKGWNIFLKNLEKFIVGQIKLTIEWKLGYYNSASNRFISDMFRILTAKLKARATINWYYLEADWTMMEDGEMYKENNPYLYINLIEIKQ